MRMSGLFAFFVPLLVQAQSALFDSSDPAKRPFSVPLSEIQERLNNDPAVDGIRLSVSIDGQILRLDLISVPGETSLAAVMRVVMMIGRLAAKDYEEMRFSDDDEDIFVMPASEIQSIGREFVWGEEGKGQNPIHLIRLFANALRRPDGSRVAPEMTGSLLGDTAAAMKTINEVFHREWTMRNTEIL